MSDDDEAIASASAALVAHGHGTAWVLPTGALGNSWSSAGTVNSTRLAAGQYQVNFEGIPYVLGRATAQVVAYNSNEHCKLFGTPLGNGARTFVNVLCYSPSGALTDSAFAVRMDMRQGPDAANPGGYAFVSASSTSYWYSSKGNTDEWKPTAQWVPGENTTYVTFPGLGYLNASVHVTAVGANARRCKVVHYTDLAIQVKCYDSTGAAVSSSFTISYESGADFPGHVGGHTLINLTNLAGWATSSVPYRTCDTSTITHTLLTNKVRISQTNADVASGGSWANIQPMVTAYGESSHYCNLVSWTVFTGSGTATVDVQCYDNSGTPVSTETHGFSASIMNKAYPRGC